MVATDEFDEIFARLRRILEPHARRMHVSGDAPGMFGVDMAPEESRNPTTWFGGIRKGKRYVSYYLMPVYTEPSLLDDASPELKRRMQGKSCFNFTRVDEKLFTELESLTKKSYERTAGNPKWGAAKRVERGMAHRRAGTEFENSRAKA